MAILNLAPFGFSLKLELNASVGGRWAGSNRLIFVLCEEHRDWNMIRDNLIDACVLIDTGIVKCVGVEDAIHAPDLRSPPQLTPVQIERDSRELFQKHGTDERVITYLRSQCPPKNFRFGRVLSFLRPRVPLCRVEDPDLHDEACCIHNRLQDRRELPS